MRNHVTDRLDEMRIVLADRMQEEVDGEEDEEAQHHQSGDEVQVETQLLVLDDVLDRFGNEVQHRISDHRAGCQAEKDWGEAFGGFLGGGEKDGADQRDQAHRHGGENAVDKKHVHDGFP